MFWVIYLSTVMTYWVYMYHCYQIWRFFGLIFLIVCIYFRFCVLEYFVILLVYEPWIRISIQTFFMFLVSFLVFAFYGRCYFYVLKLFSILKNKSFCNLLCIDIDIFLSILNSGQYKSVFVCSLPGLFNINAATLSFAGMITMIV